MTLEITQAGSLAPDKTHRSLCKDRRRKQGEVSSQRLCAFPQPVPEPGSALGWEGCGWDWSEGIMKKGKGKLVQALEWDLLTEITMSGQ